MPGRLGTETCGWLTNGRLLKGRVPPNDLLITVQCLCIELGFGGLHIFSRMEVATP